MQAQYRNYPPHAPQPRRGPGPMVAAAHPQPMTPQQLQAQQHAELQKRELAKRQSRKPTDRNMPDGVDHLVVGDGVARYRALRDVERRLDAVMMRKKLDINESGARNFTRYRTMRLWITNSAENQPWQQGGMDPDAFDFGSESQATYRVKIEGRLLDDDEDPDPDKADATADADAMDQDEKTKAAKPAAAQRTKLSHFFKQITINFDRSQSLQPDGYTQIEWKKPESPAGASADSSANFDTLEFERKSDENINVTINLYRDENPERYQLSRPLAELLGTEEEDRGGILMGIWTYVKANGLQEDEDSRKIRCDAQLKALFGNRDFVPFPQIPQLIIPHLSPLPPYQLPYTIRVDKSYIAPDGDDSDDDDSTPSTPTVYDVLVPLDDPLRIAMSHITSNPAALNTLNSLDESLALAVQAIQHAKAKHAFFTSMSTDPVNFVKRWISSQQRDLEVILGEATRGGGEDVSGEEWRRGGEKGAWGGDKALESVGLWLAKGKAH